MEKGIFTRSHVISGSAFLIALFFVFFFFLPFPNFAQASITDPTGVSGLLLWLDANDIDGDGSAEGFSEAGLQDNSLNADGSANDVATWMDKSGNASHVTQATTSTSSMPALILNTFNGTAAIDFDNTASNEDWLEHILPSATTTNFSIFIVLRSDSASPGNNEAFFASDDSTSDSFQIDYGSTPNAFRIKVPNESTSANFGTFSPNELKLYVATHDGSLVTAYDNGSLAATTSVTTGRSIDRYRVNRNRGGAEYHDSTIAEIIIYDNVLSKCSFSQVNQYLGNKFGVDFSGIAAKFDEFTGTHSGGDAAGVGFFDTTGCAPELVNETAVSSIATVAIVATDTKHTLDFSDTEETFAIDHDGGALSEATGTYATGTYTSRITRTWRVDQDDPSDADTDAPLEIQKVDLRFNVSGIIDTATRTITDFVVLIDTDQDGDFSDAAVHTVGRSVDTVNDLISFTDVDMPDGSWITLATQLETASPTITITAPTKTVTDGSNITDTTINVVDNAPVQAGNVTVGASTTAGTTSFSCSQTNATTVDCTITITSSGDLYITAMDDQGNTATQSELGYDISGNIGGGGGGRNKKECEDNKDNDGDGLKDEDDPGCHTDGDPTNERTYDDDDDSEADEYIIPSLEEEALFGIIDPTVTLDAAVAEAALAAASTYLGFTDVSSETETVLVSLVVQIADVVAKLQRFGIVVAPDLVALSNAVMPSLVAANLGQTTPVLAVPSLSPQQVTCPHFTEYVQQGARGAEVLKIQEFLRQLNVFVYPENTGFYGPVTFDAIKTFQLIYKEDILDPWGFTAPTGSWFQTTRKKANELLGCNESTLILETGVIVE